MIPLHFGIQSALRMPAPPVNTADIVLYQNSISFIVLLLRSMSDLKGSEYKEGE